MKRISMIFKHHPVRVNVMGEYHFNIDANTETETKTVSAVERLSYILVV
jgi:hypothetical protein